MKNQRLRIRLAVLSEEFLPALLAVEFLAGLLFLGALAWTWLHARGAAETVLETIDATESLSQLRPLVENGS